MGKAGTLHWGFQNDFRYGGIHLGLGQGTKEFSGFHFPGQEGGGVVGKEEHSRDNWVALERPPRPLLLQRKRDEFSNNHTVSSNVRLVRAQHKYRVSGKTSFTKLFFTCSLPPLKYF